jgi:predicted helicase
MHNPNIALLTLRQARTLEGGHFFVTNAIYSKDAITIKDRVTGFPLYLYDTAKSTKDDLFVTARIRREPNLTSRFVATVKSNLSLDFVPDGRGDLRAALGPEDVFHYAYAIFHSLSYRARYTEFLRIDFPRLPLTLDRELFTTLAALGGELVALHLMESPRLGQHLTAYTGPANPQVEKVSYARDTVWLDKAQTRGFRGVPEAVWNFYIGGYQVCDKWLKDRGPRKGNPGRILTPDDIEHYQRIVVALHETIRLMGEIDEVIEEHGGWPIQ